MWCQNNPFGLSWPHLKGHRPESVRLSLKMTKSTSIQGYGAAPSSVWGFYCFFSNTPDMGYTQNYLLGWLRQIWTLFSWISRPFCSLYQMNQLQGAEMPFQTLYIHHTVRTTHLYTLKQTWSYVLLMHVHIITPLPAFTILVWFGFLFESTVTANINTCTHTKHTHRCKCCHVCLFKNGNLKVILV